MTGSATKVRVLLVDDHRVVREGVAEVLSDQPGIEVVGQADDGDVAEKMALALVPDVILMDVNMPRVSGVVATRRIKAALPDVQIVGLSMHNDDAMAKLMRQAGAVEYVQKAASSETLIATVLRLGPATTPAAEQPLRPCLAAEDLLSLGLRLQHYWARFCGEMVTDMLSIERGMRGISALLGSLVEWSVLDKRAQSTKKREILKATSASDR